MKGTKFRDSLKYLEDRCPNKVFACVEMQAKTSSSCFKIIVNLTVKYKIEDPNFWLIHSESRRFRTKDRESTSFSYLVLCFPGPLHGYCYSNTFQYLKVAYNARKNNKCSLNLLNNYLSIIPKYFKSFWNEFLKHPNSACTTRSFT